MEKKRLRRKNPGKTREKRLDLEAMSRAEKRLKRVQNRRMQTRIKYNKNSDALREGKAINS